MDSSSPKPRPGWDALHSVVALYLLHASVYLSTRKLVGRACSAGRRLLPSDCSVLLCDIAVSKSVSEPGSDCILAMPPLSSDSFGSGGT